MFLVSALLSFAIVISTAAVVTASALKVTPATVLAKGVGGRCHGNAIDRRTGILGRLRHRAARHQARESIGIVVHPVSIGHTQLKPCLFARVLAAQQQTFARGIAEHRGRHARVGTVDLAGDIKHRIRCGNVNIDRHPGTRCERGRRDTPLPQFEPQCARPQGTAHRQQAGRRGGLRFGQALHFHAERGRQGPPMAVADTAELFDDVADTAFQPVTLVNLPAASASVDTMDLICPNAEILVCTVAACSLSLSSGCFSMATSCETIDLTSRPLPIPEMRSFAIPSPFQMQRKLCRQTRPVNRRIHPETRQFLRPWRIDARKPNGGGSPTAAAWRLAGGASRPHHL